MNGMQMVKYRLTRRLAEHYGIRWRNRGAWGPATSDTDYNIQYKSLICVIYFDLPSFDTLANSIQIHFINLVSMFLSLHIDLFSTWSLYYDNPDVCPRRPLLTRRPSIITMVH